MTAHKTIAEITRDYLVENGDASIDFGDTWNLDAVCARCTHTNLHDLHPLERHRRMLNALEKSPLFAKRYIKYERRYRCFWLVDKVPERLK